MFLLNGLKSNFGVKFTQKFAKNSKSFTKMDKKLDKFGRAFPPKAGKYHVPKITTDAVVIKPFNVSNPSESEILMITRLHGPYKGNLALPGGFVDYNEAPEIGVVRELFEETHLKGKVHSLVGAYGDPQRDPRGHVITLAYRIQVDEDAVPKAGDDAASATFMNLQKVIDFGEEGKIAFDHYDIIKDALKASQKL